MDRYRNECQALAKLAARQLNLPKNRNKENFEDMHLFNILSKLSEEVDELKRELIVADVTGPNFKVTRIVKPQIDFEKAFCELGDTAACLAGLIAKLNRHRNELNDDCA